jgi:serine/threonine-protein kinase
VNPAVPAALDAIVLRALAKDPAQRFADAEEFIAVLLREREPMPAGRTAAVLAAAAHGPEGTLGAAHSPPPTGVIPLGGSPAGGGALLLPAAGSFDQEPPHSAQDGRRKRMLLWALAATLLAVGVALALLLSSSPSKRTVPDVVGQTEQSASATLRRDGLTPAPSLATSATVATGSVISQTPTQGSRVDSGSHVSIVVSSGPASAALGNVEGLTAAQALAQLRAAGFKPTSKTQPSANVAQGRVIGTNPPAGTELQVGSPVAVLVSSGPAQVHVPDVIGESQAAAEAALTAAGLTVGTVTHQAAAGQTVGNVLSQSPRPAASLPAGGAVSLTVAQAPNEVAVPSVVGNSETQAAAALGEAGFKPKSVSATTTDPAQVGLVQKQSPAAGVRARKGATVTLTVGVLGPQTTPTTPTTTPTTTTPTTTTTTTTTTTSPPALPPAG